MLNELDKKFPSCWLGPLSKFNSLGVHYLFHLVRWANRAQKISESDTKFLYIMIPKLLEDLGFWEPKSVKGSKILNASSTIFECWKVSQEWVVPTEKKPLRVHQINHALEYTTSFLEMYGKWTYIHEFSITHYKLQPSLVLRCSKIAHVSWISTIHTNARNIFTEPLFSCFLIWTPKFEWYNMWFGVAWRTDAKRTC